MKSADIADHTLPNGNEGQTELPPSVAARCPIMLVAVNARYSHSSFSVRTLKANLHELEELCAIFEADITINPFQLAAHIAEAQPIVVGF